MPVLRSSVERLEAGAEIGLADCPARVIYVVEGRVRLATQGAAAKLGANDAWFAEGPTRVKAAAPAVLIRWELLPGEQAEAAGAGEAAEALARPITLAPERRYLLRADRVDFPPKGVAYLHTHQGPGIRCLIKGTIRIDSEGHSLAVAPLGAWFESGPEPVFAAASDSADTAFVRVMVLPLELLGKSSIRYVRPEDQDKPKPQRYEVFLDQPLAPWPPRP